MLPTKMTTLEEDSIIAALHEQPMTYVELCKATQMSMTRLRNRIGLLINAGKVQRAGKRKSKNGLMAEVLALASAKGLIEQVVVPPRPWVTPRFKSIFAGGINPWHIYENQQQ
jgi:hypothetical protein